MSDWTTARVVHCDASLWRRDGFQWKGIGHTGACSPLSALCMSMSGPVTVVVDADGGVVCDLSTITSLDGDVHELVSDWLTQSTAPNAE